MSKKSLERNKMLEKTIYKRQSTRSYMSTSLDQKTLEEIKNFGEQAKPLNSDIKVTFKIVGPESIKSILAWRSPYYIAIFSEEKNNYLNNIGFIFQQFDLYLQSIGLASCWVGIGKFSGAGQKDVFQDAIVIDNDLKFIILLAFGSAKDNHGERSIEQFKRKTLVEISDYPDERLEAARLAPSAMNSQPWYFSHDNNIIHVYSINQNIAKRIVLSYMNKIDIGIALAHLYITNSNTFRLVKAKAPQQIKGYYYVCSISI